MPVDLKYHSKYHIRHLKLLSEYSNLAFCFFQFLHTSHASCRRYSNFWLKYWEWWQNGGGVLCDFYSTGIIKKVLTEAACQEEAWCLGYRSCYNYWIFSKYNPKNIRYVGMIGQTTPSKNSPWKKRMSSIKISNRIVTGKIIFDMDV